MAYEYSGVPAGAVGGRRAVNIVRWGAVWSGTIIGVGCMVILSALWLALGYGSGNDVFTDNISWWLGGTGIFSFFVGGLLSGAISGTRGIFAGFLNSTTMWALVTFIGVLVSLVIGAGTLNVNNADSLSTLDAQIPDSALWTAFWSMLIGLGAALLGGALGGLMHRSVTYPPVEDRGYDGAYPREERIERDHDDHVTAGERTSARHRHDH